MKKKIVTFLVIILAVLIAAYLVEVNPYTMSLRLWISGVGVKYISKNGTQNIQQNPFSNETPVSSPENSDTPASTNGNKKDIPFDWAGERVIKKPFGIYITPQNSPVQPERFKGYHTGADYEILPGEENIDVLVQTVCDGKMRTKQYVSGYGGVAVQNCVIGGENVTVLYGHLSLASIKQKVGDEILEMGFIGNLGDPAKGETDGERKHLHLGIHRGSQINFRGYVSSKSELSSWIDPCLYFCQ